MLITTLAASRSTPTRCCGSFAGCRSARRSPRRLRRACSRVLARRRAASGRGAADAPDGAPRGARGRLALLARSSAARSTVRWTWPRRSRCAASRRPAVPRAQRRPWSRHDLAFAASRRRACSRSRSLGRLAGARLASTPIRSIHDAGRRRRRSRCAWRCSWPRCCRSATGGGSSHERAAAVASSVSPTAIPGTDARRSERRQPRDRSRASSACSPGSPATASRRCCAPRAGSCRTSTAARFAGRVTLAGLDTREHGPRASAAFVGRALPGPRDAARDELGARRARARAREPRARARRRSRAGWRRSRSRSASTPARPLARTSSRAARSSASRSARRSPGRPRIVLLDEPTSQLDPVAGDELIGLLRRLNQEWETTIVLAEHRLERCLAAADRVIALDARRGRAATATRRLPAVGGGRARRRCRRPARELFALAGLRPPPAGVQAGARDAARARRCCPMRTRPRRRRRAGSVGSRTRAACARRGRRRPALAHARGLARAARRAGDPARA